MRRKANEISLKGTGFAAGFSIIPIVGIVLWKLCAYSLFRGVYRDDIYPSYAISMVTQLIVTAAFLLLEYRGHHNIVTRRSVVIAAGLLMALGVMLAKFPLIFGYVSPLLIQLGAIVHGAASVPLLLGMGFYLSSIEPRRSAIYIASAFFLFSILSLPFNALDSNVQVACAIVIPFLAAIFLILSIAREKVIDLEEQPLTVPIIKNLPWGMFLLLMGCGLAGDIMSALLTPQTPLSHGAENFFWPTIFVLILIAFAVWIFLFKRDDPEKLWPLFAIIIFAGLFFFSSLGFMTSWSQTLLSATQNCLVLFYWVFLTGLAFREKLPRVLLFGIGNLVFGQLNYINALLFGKIVSSYGQTISHTVVSAVAGIMAFVIIVSTVILLTKETVSRHVLEDDAAMMIIGKMSPMESIDCAVETITQKYHLTSREAEITTMLSRGYTLPRIAKELFISLDTVRSHSKSIYRKLDIHRKQDLLDLIDAAASKRP